VTTRPRSLARARVERYLDGDDLDPLWLEGDAADVLAELPPACVDVCLTSPPYWGHRRYASGGLGEEHDPRIYVERLLEMLGQVQRVLKTTGSLWLNVGDAYRAKGLQGIPWRVAIALVDEQRWTLRNSVIWHKVKGGPDNARDRLRNVHEHLFHLVKRPRGYHYDVDAVRAAPRKARVEGGVVVSATGVRGVRYRRQIELSTALDEDEKTAALDALDAMLADVGAGRLSDFRMVIRRQQRTTHSDAAAVSGRARELQQRGYYFLRYHPRGAKPPDVWDILPEDTQGRAGHFAPYPEDLCRIPLLTTCPPGGVVLDPFCGTGTTNLAARRLGHRSLGIDLSAEYLELAATRCREAFPGPG
jgi:site-specific DNA-methyltransferase (adenine-specific)